MRNNAFTSGSCGWADSGSEKKTTKIDHAFDDFRTNLLISAQRPAVICFKQKGPFLAVIIVAVVSGAT